jgi:hypothetical protein
MIDLTETNGFSSKVGTIFEDSLFLLRGGLVAVWMISNSRNVVSSYERARTIGVTQRSAWFIRAAYDGLNYAELTGNIGETQVSVLVLIA